MRLTTVLLVFALTATAEESTPPSEERPNAASGDVTHDVDSVRNEARGVILAAGVSALPKLRERMRQAPTPLALKRLASVIDLLEVEPAVREALDSIGPFAMSPDGRSLATYRSDNKVLLKSWKREHEVDPEDGVEAEFEVTREALAAPAPVFLNSRCVAIPPRNRIEMNLFELNSGERCGSLTCETDSQTPARVRYGLVQVLRMDEKRFISVSSRNIWVQEREMGNALMTFTDWPRRILNVAVRAGGFVALYRHRSEVSEGMRMSRWDGKSLKIMTQADAPFGDADLMDAGRDSRLIAVGSSKSARIAISTSDSLEFGKPRESGLGPDGLSALAVSPDGAWVAMGSPDGHVLIRLATTWELLAQLKPGGKVTQLAFSDDGSTLGVQAGDKLHVYDVRHP